MKIVRTILIWILISLSLQTVLLLYLNKYYFADEKNIIYKDVNIKKTKSTPSKEIKLPTDCKDFQVSFDGKFISYYEGSVLIIENIRTNEKKEISIDVKSVKSIYKWIDDRDIIIIAETQIVDNGSTVRFYSYDVKDSIKVETKDFVNNRDVLIKLPDENAEISDIIFNTMNTIFYPKITVSKNVSYVYRLDVSMPIEKLSYISTNIDKMCIIKQEDKIVYEIGGTNGVYIGKDTNPIEIENTNSFCEFTVDTNGLIYVGAIKNNKVYKLFYGKSNEAFGKWKSVALDEPYDKNDIYVSLEGRIYINNRLAGIVKELNTNKKYSYEGKFVKFFDKGIISLKDDVIVSKIEFTN